jgi:hypothetical protein
MDTRPLTCTFLDGTVVKVTPCEQWSLRELIARETGHRSNTLLLLDSDGKECKEYGCKLSSYGLHGSREATVIVRPCPVHRKYTMRIQSIYSGRAVLMFGLTFAQDGSGDVEANWAMLAECVCIDIAVELVPNVSPPQHLITLGHCNQFNHDLSCKLTDFQEIKVMYTSSLQQWVQPKQMMTSDGMIEITKLQVYDDGIDSRYEEHCEAQKVVQE